MSIASYWINEEDALPAFLQPCRPEADEVGSEVIRMSPAKAHLTLGVKDVLLNGGVDVFHASERHNVQMMVQGDDAGSISLVGDLDRSSIGPGDWALEGQYLIDGVRYNSYQHSGFDIELLVQTHLTVRVFE